MNTRERGTTFSMATVARNEQLRETDGFRLESSQGTLGSVEEVWLDDADEPCALAVRTQDGRRALLFAADVVAVQREQRWVVVDARPGLLELAPPHLVSRGDGTGAQVSASWTTTGASIPTEPRPARRLRPPRAPAGPAEEREGSLWLAVAVLYAFIGVFVAALIGLAFAVASLVAGNAY
jgi:hypothetical protein